MYSQRFAVKLFKSQLNYTGLICRLCNSQINLTKLVPNCDNKPQIIDLTNLDKNESNVDVTVKKKSVLEDCTEDISHVAPYLKPTFNFAAYINKSETLQKLVQLGVNLHILERKHKVPEFILRLDFETDVKKYILLFNDLKIDDIGTLITKNPYILKEDIKNLIVRINYLRYKKFKDEMITRIVSRNPFWLTFSTHKIDERLGFFQKQYSLTGDEVRFLATKQPKLITYKMHNVKINTFAIKEEMGFTSEEIKLILLKKPNVFMKDQNFILKTFEYFHHVMKIPLEVIAEFPEILMCREFRVKQRHMFMEQLGRAQYNPKEPNYVSPLSLVSGTDAEFCETIAKSSIQAFNMFLKSL